MKALIRLVAGVAVLCAAPALAAPSDSVSSDGSAPVAAVSASSTMTPSYEGTGVPLATTATTESAADVWALWRRDGVSAGNVNPMSIIGHDDRTLVNPTTKFPARAIVLITFSGGRCTGFLVNANTVVTAGHCIAAGGKARWYPTTSYTIYPGRNGSQSPYRFCKATGLYTVSGWFYSGRDDYDYGAIKLDCTIGTVTGYFGLFVTKQSLNGRPANVWGYPTDKPLTQWKATDVVRVTQARRVFYRTDTNAGDSGAPVFYKAPKCGNCAIAIDAYGVYGSNPFKTNNHGTRITAEVYNNIMAWRAAN